MTKQETKISIIAEEMLKVGVHFGHQISSSHPKMKPFLFGTRNNVQLIDPEKTAEKLQEILPYIQELSKEKNALLLIGTKIQIKKTVEEIARDCGLPWVSERWLGGTFTNFEVIKKRVDYLKSLKIQKASGELEKYTKKERMGIEKEIQGLQLRLGGIENLENLPKAIFVCDMKKDLSAIKEARKKGIKIIGIADTNVDPTLADYPIPANDDAVSSVRYILERVKEAILENKTEIKTT
ncbi:MAG: 30S ribosomal protein S2 [bacterium]|nr:30S ribosomal protein S2 [bacterium]